MLLYFIFFAVVLIYVGRPLHLIRQMYYSYARFVRRVRAIVNWRRATRNLNERFPVLGFRLVADLCIVRDKIVADSHTIKRTNERTNRT